MSTVQKALRDLAAALAREKSIPPPSHLKDNSPKRPNAFDADRVWRWLRALPDPRVHTPLMRFAGWLWKTGIHDMDVLMAMLEDRCKRNPDNAYAYYAKGGPGRVENAARFSSEITEREHEMRKREEREAFGCERRAIPVVEPDLRGGDYRGAEASD